MKYDAEALYRLIPAIYRIRDTEQDESLKALVSVIAEQMGVLEESLDQAYDDLFIETCADWVIPYIGDLIGYRSFHDVVPEIASPRSEVAQTIRLRRGKGTATVLEEVARTVSGWPARVVEFFELLATTQYMNHIRPHSLFTPDLRKWEPLERFDTAFDTVAHTVDVRRIDGRLSRGRHNIPNVGIYLWRLNDYPLTASPAARHDERRWLFSPLGNNAPLFTHAQPENEIPHLAEPINVPEPISRRVLHEQLDRYYGTRNSFSLIVDGTRVDISRVRACDLSDVEAGAWAHQTGDHFGIDPVLGRIVTPQNEDDPADLRVTFHYGFSANMGGGEYERRASFDAELQPVEQISDGDSIQTAIGELTAGGVVEMTDSGRYEQAVSIHGPSSRRIEVRSANEQRATLVLSEEMKLSGGGDSEITLNGLLISGGTLHVPAGEDNQLRLLRLRHCTLVPGIALDLNGKPQNTEFPSLIVESPDVTVEIERSIVGSLRIVEGARVKISDSIVDATNETGLAYAGDDVGSPGGTLEISNSTIVGRVHALEMPLVSNTIFAARRVEDDPQSVPVRVAQKQDGCVRFSYVPLDSRVPRRFRCQPELAIRQANKAVFNETGQEPTDAEKASTRTRIVARLQAVFSETRYGQPAYMQLASRPIEIRNGADDEAEMGAFHDLFQPQRETNVRIRLEEYLRFGLEAGIFYAT